MLWSDDLSHQKQAEEIILTLPFEDLPRPAQSYLHRKALLDWLEEIRKTKIVPPPPVLSYSLLLERRWGPNFKRCPLIRRPGVSFWFDPPRGGIQVSVGEGFPYVECKILQLATTEIKSLSWVSRGYARTSLIPAPRRGLWVAGRSHQ
jgi:hypothetical protein